MKKFLFLTNYPSPYRVCFFDELGKSADVTVLFSDRAEEKTHRDAEWFVEGEGRFRRVQLGGRLGRGKKAVCLEVLSWLRRGYDAVIVCGYATPTAMLAMAWLRLRRIPFCMEVDGGLVREESRLKYRFKRLLVSAPNAWLSSGQRTTEYLIHYGARREAVAYYPFTSLWQRDILPQLPTQDEKRRLRQKLGMDQERIVLYVGRFTREKGMDALLEAAVSLDGQTGVYFVGGEPKQRHLDFCRDRGLDNVRFVGFRKKEALAEYYMAADVLALPTHSDVWGLVVNEAMACGLPVVTTDRCVAGLELITPGANGQLVPVEDIDALAGALNSVLEGDCRAMGAAALETIRPYTLENMAQAHLDYLDRR